MVLPNFSNCLCMFSCCGFCAISCLNATSALLSFKPFPLMVKANPLEEGANSISIAIFRVAVGLDNIFSKASSLLRNKGVPAFKSLGIVSGKSLFPSARFTLKPSKRFILFIKHNPSPLAKLCVPATVK